MMLLLCDIFGGGVGEAERGKAARDDNDEQGETEDDGWW
jgi:hypothetical protein